MRQISRSQLNRLKSNRWIIDMQDSLNVTIQLADSASTALELSNVLIDAVLYIQGHVRYRFYAGKTNEQGCLHVTFDQLENSRLENQSFSIMDYNTKLQECDSRISFLVLSLDEILQRRAITEKWFPEDVSESEYFVECNNGMLMCKNLDIDTNVSVSKVFLTCECVGRLTFGK